MYVTITKYPYLMLDCERRAEMERLTERFNNGQAAVMGCGENCKYDYKYCRNHYEECPEINKIYERLAEYEDTGLTPPEIMELKERDTAKMCKQSIFDHDSITCVCGSDMDKKVEFMFCPWCGQRLKKWED